MYSSNSVAKPIRWVVVLLAISHISIMIRSSTGPDYAVSYNLTNREQATINLYFSLPETKGSIVITIDFMVRVSYFSRLIKGLNCMKRNVIFEQHPEDYRAHCLAELFKFSHQDDMATDGVTEFYCRVHRRTYTINSTTTSVTLTDLLPNQSYQLNVTIAILGDEKPYTTITHTSCNPPGFPQYPPQADYPTFDIIRPVDQGRSLMPEEEVVLYWRPVPLLLSGDESLEYELVCTGSDNSSLKAIVPGHMGSYTMTKPINVSRICKLTSFNNIGHNTRASRIVIPAHEQRIDLGKDFKLSIQMESNQKYELEWNPIVNHSGSIEVLPRHHTGEVRPSGYFMIYWCVLTHSVGCKEISGMVKLDTSKTNYTLKLPELSEPGKRSFGFSYSNLDGTRSTGIIWSKCSPEKLDSKPVKITHGSEVGRSNESIPIEWILSPCDSEFSRINSFDIEYCRVSSLEGYDVIWRSQPPKVAASNSSDDCTTISRPYSFIDEELIRNLNSSTRYNIRVRYNYKNVTKIDKSNNTTSNTEEHSGWSNTLSAYTEADPDAVRSHWWGLLIWISSIIVTTGVVCSLMYMKTRVYWLHSKLLVSRFTQTRANLGDTMIGFTRKDSELSLRYCLNKAGSELSLSILDSDEGAAQKCRMNDYVDSLPYQQSIVDQTFEYLPRKLFEGNQEEGTVESCSDSAQGATKFEISSDTQDGDDISIDSHSSFLNTLLNEQSDLNNNQDSQIYRDYGDNSI